MKKNITILGSNNHLGVKALEFFSEYSSKFNIYALSYDSKISNINEFIEQIKNFKPKVIFIDNKKAEEYIISKIDVDVYCGDSNFINFIKSTDIGEIVSALFGVDSVKKILSAIYEYKDITLLNTSPILYSGGIIPREAKSKAVKLNIFSHPVYAINQFIKSNRLKDVNKAFLYTLKRKNKEKTIDSTDFDSFISFLKHFYSVNKIRLVNDMFLVHYIYNLPIDKFDFFEQSIKLIGVNLKFNNGSNLIHATNIDLRSIFNYYFLENDGHLIKNNAPDMGDFTISFNKVDIKNEKFLELGVEALKRGGICPIVYYITCEIVASMIYHNKLKKTANLYKILLEVKEDNTLHNKYPDLNTIYSVESKIKKFICDKYCKKGKITDPFL